MSTIERVTNFSIDDAINLINECDTGRRITPNNLNFGHAGYLWDSGFISAGLAYEHPKRAKLEQQNTIATQHEDGMLAHMAYRQDLSHLALKHFVAWGSGKNEAQARLHTSGMTQPPVIATMTRVVAEQLGNDRQPFLRSMYGGLVKYHEWFLRERDPDHDDVVTILHPWESGMDNSPSMVAGIKTGRLERTIGRLINPLRSDVRQGLDPNLRTSPEDCVALQSLVYKLRARHYDSQKILANNPSYGVDSVIVNNILLKSTKDLAWIASQIGKELPERLINYLGSSRSIINKFWDSTDKRFYDIDARTGRHIKIPTVSNVLPMINHEDLTEQQGNIVSGLMRDETEFYAPHGLPTVSRSSSFFNPDRYWQGASWPWLVRYQALAAREMGDQDLSSHLGRAVLGSVSRYGAFEHYNPLTGEAGGAHGFAPVASTYIELAHNY